MHMIPTYRIVVYKYVWFRLCEPNEQLNIAPDSVAIVRFLPGPEGF